MSLLFFISSSWRHTRLSLVTGVEPGSRSICVRLDVDVLRVRVQHWVVVAVLTQFAVNVALEFDRLQILTEIGLEVAEWRRAVECFRQLPGFALEIGRAHV